MKLSSKDKPFITVELKRIDRRRRREYLKRGKSDKYWNLKKLFDQKYKFEAQNILIITLMH